MAKSLEDYVKEAREMVREIEPADVAGYLSEGWRLLDVREPDEFSDGHIEGAYHVPRGLLEVHADHQHHKRDPQLQDRSQRFVCYCGGGYRSLLAAKVLKEMGFADAVSVVGGWRKWVEEGRPIARPEPSE